MKASYCAKVGMVLLKLTDLDLIGSLYDLWGNRKSHDGYYDKVIEKARVLYNNNVFLAYAETYNDVSLAMELGSSMSN